MPRRILNIVTRHARSAAVAQGQPLGPGGFIMLKYAPLTNRVVMPVPCKNDGDAHAGAQLRDMASGTVSLINNYSPVVEAAGRS